MHNDLFSIGPLTVHGYGLMIGIGFVLAVVLGSLFAKRRGLDPDRVYTIGILGIVTGFLGGKLLYLIVEWKAFLNDPLAVLGSSGFVVYGGLLVGIFSVYLYCRIQKQDFILWFDTLIPFVALAQGFGRIGCFLAGCCYGAETSGAFGVVFPSGSIAPSGIPLLPTQLFSAVGDFLLFGILLLITCKSHRRALSACCYLVLYGIGRFLLEFFRGDPRGSVGVFSTSQFLSLFLLLGAGLLFVLTAKRGTGKEESGTTTDEKQK